MSNRFDVSGKVALVTGGNRGLGRKIALGFAQSGADVAVISRRHCPDIEAELQAQGVRGKSYAFDLANFDEFDHLVENIVADFGRIDILINNAGVQKRHPSTQFPMEDWDFVLGVNCKAPFLLCQKVGRLMLEKGCGKIVNIASLLSFQGGLTVPAYTASKAAVAGFTKSLSNEWARLGVNVNCIAPGYMATDMNEALINDETRSRQILERIPAGRWGSTDDITGTAIFLCSPAADYISGATIVVDGGWLGR